MIYQFCNFEDTENIVTGMILKSSEAVVEDVVDVEPCL